MNKRVHKGFTLIEILVVVGIIAILIAASMAGFSKMMKSAETARTRELVSNAVTAMTALYEADGIWPKLIRTRSMGSGEDDGLIDKDVALILAKRGFLSLSMDAGKTRLVGNDRFGLLTPWAAKSVESLGTTATLESRVTGGYKVKDNLLNFAVDIDGDGEITSDECGGRTGESVIRASVAVWSIGKPGMKAVKSWTEGQTKAVK